MAGEAAAKAQALPLRTRFFYGWVIVGVAVMVTFMQAAMSNPMLSLCVKHMGDEFGWSRGAISLATTIGSLLGVEHASLLGSAGYAKTQVKQELWEVAKVPREHLIPEMQHFLEHKPKRKKALVDGSVHTTGEPEGLAVVIACGFGPHSQFYPTLGFDPYDAQTRQVLFKGDTPVPPPRRAGPSVYK